MSTSRENGPFVVHGTVSDASGPVKGLCVFVYDRDLRKEQLLGSSDTSTEGTYSVSYLAKQFSRAEKDSADLVIKVYSGKDQSSSLYETPFEGIVFNAPPDCTINVHLSQVINTIQPEFAVISSTIKPLLDGVALKDLKEDEKTRDVSFLANETGIENYKITNFAVSYKLATVSELPPEFSYALLASKVLLKLDLKSAAGFRFDVNLSTELKPLLYDIVLLNADEVKVIVQDAVKVSRRIGPKILSSLPEIQKYLDSMRQEALDYVAKETVNKLTNQVEELLVSNVYDKALEVFTKTSPTNDLLGDLPGLFQKLQDALTPTDQESKVSEQEINVSQALGFNEILVQSIKEAQVDDEKHLATLSEGDWKSLLEKGIASKAARSESTAIDASSRDIRPELIDLHAKNLAREFERKYPNVAFAARLKHDIDQDTTVGFLSSENRKVILDLFEKNKSLDLATVNIRRLINQSHSLDSGDVLSTAGQTTSQWTDSAISDLNALQRLFKLSPRFDHAKNLMKADLKSSASIHAMGETQFVKKFSENGTFDSKSEAQKIFRKASDVHIASTMVAGELSALTAATRVRALGGQILDTAKLEAVTKEFPNMTSLFQLGDFCACMECQTVHSAAAYLVDTLEFLKDRLVTDTTVVPIQPGAKKAKDVLFSRRPDLGDLDLNCDNTNVSLPYIDIVCELLEDTISPDPGIPFTGTLAEGPIPQGLLDILQNSNLNFTTAAILSKPYGPKKEMSLRDAKEVATITPVGTSGWTVRRLKQTYGTTDQLSAAPMYVSEDVYKNILQKSKYAFSLPFNLYHQESLSYLKQFGLSRADMMQSFGKDSAPMLHESVAAEFLNLTSDERPLIVTPDPSGQKDYWGVTTGDVVDYMKNVDKFVVKTGVTYLDLLTLLTLSWINPDKKLTIIHLDETCDLKMKEIGNLDAPSLDRFHRFIRLWKKLGWKPWIINEVITTPQLRATVPPDLTDKVLIHIEKISRLSNTIQMDPDTLILFYSVLPSDGDQSLYVQRFLNSSAVGAVNPDFVTANVVANESIPLGSTTPPKMIRDYADYIALCLGITVVDTKIYLGLLNDPDKAILSFRNITAIFSYLTLSRKLKVASTDFAILQGLTRIDALSTPEATLKFISNVRTIQASRLSVTDLAYYLTRQLPSTELMKRDVSESALESVLLLLKTSYVQIDAHFATYNVDINSTYLENKPAVLELLGTLSGLSQSDISRFITIFDNSIKDATATAFVLSKLSFLSPTSSQAQNIADSIAALQAVVTGANADGLQNSLLKAVLDPLKVYLSAEEKKATLLSTIESPLKVSEALARILLTARVNDLGPPVALLGNAQQILLDDKIKTDVPSTLLPQIRTLRLLYSIVSFVTASKMPDEAVSWLLSYGDSIGAFRLDDIVSQDGVPPIKFDAWLALNSFLDLVNAYPAQETFPGSSSFLTVYGMLEKAIPPSSSRDDFLKYACGLTGWDLETVKSLDAHFGFSDLDLKQYLSLETYNTLSTALMYLRRLNMELPDALNVVQTTLGPAETKILRQALKSQYDDSSWLPVLKSLQDPLREMKRDALVAYLLVTYNSAGITSSDELYEYFLIDVEMTPKVSTSRVVQAHATIQLFIQRCLMGLEPTSVASVAEDIRWGEWQWMANFRVWEANRKVFLWPENWIDPRLRLNKSELFKKLEDTLQQNALTDDNVESGVLTYLEELDDISSMDVMACYYQVSILTMHVFARTKGGSPPVYYYRQFLKEQLWTPWEKLGLEIPGDHLVAFERNNRLMLAWPIFTKEPDPAQVNSSSIPDPDDLKGTHGAKKTQQLGNRWAIQLAISDRVGGKWRPQKQSRGSLYWPPPDPSGLGNYRINLEDTQYFNFFYWDTVSQAVSCVILDIWVGSFALTGCKGCPEPNPATISQFCFVLPMFENAPSLANRFSGGPASTTNSPDLAIWSTFSDSAFRPLLKSAGSQFKVTYPLQISTIDWLINLIGIYTKSRYSFASFNNGSKSSNLLSFVREMGPSIFVQLGLSMPYFYGDFSKNYVIIPNFYSIKTSEDMTYSDLIVFVNNAVALFQKLAGIVAAQPSGQKDLNAARAELEKDPTYQDFIVQWYFLISQSTVYRMLMQNFFHPLICPIRVVANTNGLTGLFSPATQLLVNQDFNFTNTYDPDLTFVRKPLPTEDVDFNPDGSYSSYNWELFFHAPFEIAMSLNQDQKFEQARSWYHYIFNPMGANEASAPQKYWVTKPFFQFAKYAEQRIDTIFNQIAEDPHGLQKDLRFAVDQWRANPFQPHVVAQTRTVAYQMSVVMNYVKNLIDWGDSLFRQYTRESITQATQLYILADKLLGPKPRIVPPAVKSPPRTYNQLADDIDFFGNALVDLENLVPDLGDPSGGSGGTAPSPLRTLYFCIPPNENLLSYWDLVADRLFKIRNSQNIDGVEVPLALFSPPIDPGALVRAVAGGLSISSVIASLSAPIPNYRFNVLTRKANDVTEQVKALGSLLLQCLEKRDSEALARLQSGQEIVLNNATTAVKNAAITEAQADLQSLKLQRAVLNEKKSFYTSQSFMNPWEITAVSMSGAALISQAFITLGYALSGGLVLIPNIMAGAAGFGASPQVGVSMGGDKIAEAATKAANALQSLNSTLDRGASMAVTQGTYQRRYDEWQFQVRTADDELAKLEQDIKAKGFHIDMLVTDLSAQLVQNLQSIATDSFMRNKYTNQELYDWHIATISSIYFKAYNLAFDTAKKAERCLQHELGTDQSFLTYGWDSLKKGLLAGESLTSSIKAMEMAYIDQHKREYELKKHVSLSILDPEALLRLKISGSCTISIPEALFDLDHPGHYFRRHKTVSISIPCIAGPYTSVSCRLSLVTNKYRKSSDSGSSGYTEDVGRDMRFAYNIGTVQSIATSNCQNDNGMFELSFGDDRYLPFEGTGAVATWLIELPTQFTQFDYSSIADIILHISYTSREGGSLLKKAVITSQYDALNAMVDRAGKQGLFQAYNIRNMFPTEWFSLFSTSGAGKTTLLIEEKHVPAFFRGQSIKVESVDWLARIPQVSSAQEGLLASLLVVDEVKVKLAKATIDGVDMTGWYRGAQTGELVIGTAINVGVHAGDLVVGDLVMLVKFSLAKA